MSRRHRAQCGDTRGNIVVRKTLQQRPPPRTRYRGGTGQRSRCPLVSGKLVGYGAAQRAQQSVSLLLSATVSSPLPPAVKLLKCGRGVFDRSPRCPRSLPRSHEGGLGWGDKDTDGQAGRAMGIACGAGGMRGRRPALWARQLRDAGKSCLGRNIRVRLLQLPRGRGGAGPAAPTPTRTPTAARPAS